MQPHIVNGLVGLKIDFNPFYFNMGVEKQDQTNRILIKFRATCKTKSLKKKSTLTRYVFNDASMEY